VKLLQQCERLQRVYGHLLPIIESSEDSSLMVYPHEVDRTILRKWLRRPVASTKLLALQVGKDAKKCEVLLMHVTLAIAIFNGKQLGLTERQVVKKLSLKYGVHAWRLRGDMGIFTFAEVYQELVLRDIQPRCNRRVEELIEELFGEDRSVELTFFLRQLVEKAPGPIIFPGAFITGEDSLKL
jgi:hypothetical protein